MNGSTSNIRASLAFLGIVLRFEKNQGKKTQANSQKKTQANY